MARKVSISEMADAVAEELLKYANLTTDAMKNCVKNASGTVKKKILTNAPVKSGSYKRSWKISKKKETGNSLEMAIHSRNRYQLSHLLENGHAMRNGGRARAFVHIAPAERDGIRDLTEGIERSLKG